MSLPALRRGMVRLLLAPPAAEALQQLVQEAAAAAATLVEPPHGGARRTLLETCTSFGSGSPNQTIPSTEAIVGGADACAGRTTYGARAAAACAAAAAAQPPPSPLPSMQPWWAAWAC